MSGTGALPGSQAAPGAEWLGEALRLQQQGRKAEVCPGRGCSHPTSSTPSPAASPIFNKQGGLSQLGALS